MERKNLAVHTDRAFIAHLSSASAEQIASAVLQNACISKFTKITSLAALDRELCRTIVPSLVVIDQALFENNNEEFNLEYFTNKFPQCIFAAVLSVPTRANVIRMLQAGFQGVIPRAASGDAITQLISLILAGFAFLPSRDWQHNLKSRELNISLNSCDAREISRANALSRLSERQRQVFDLIGEGMSNKMIARRIGVQEGTVKYHVSSLLRAMDFGSRAAAAAWHARMSGVLQLTSNAA